MNTIKLREHMCISGTDALCLGEAKASLPRTKMLNLMAMRGGRLY